MSMPPEVRWTYQRVDEAGSPEARLLSHFLVRKDWV
jgi:coproporphyrinogen III oxidase